MEVEVSVMDVERPGVAVTSQTKMAWLETSLPQEGVTPMEPPLAQVNMSMAGQKEASGMSEVPIKNVVTGTVSVPSTPATTGRIALEEVLLQEGSASLGVGVGSS
jgi:hypothetical protein